MTARSLSTAGTLSMSDLMIFFQPRYAAALAAFGLTTLDDFLANQAGRLVSAHGLTHTRRIEFAHAGQIFAGYLKTYDYTRRPLRHRFIRDKARREAENFTVLRHRCGLPVPTVVCIGARRRLGALVRSFILTLELPASSPLAEAWDRAPADRAELLARSPGVVARMHAAGFVHLDLRWRNILVCCEGDRPVEFAPIDCVRGGLRRSRLGREHGRLRDLSSLYKDARLQLTQSQLLRWYLAYEAALGDANPHRRRGQANEGERRRLDGLHRQAIRVILRDRDSKDGSPA